MCYHHGPATNGANINNELSCNEGFSQTWQSRDQGHPCHVNRGPATHARVHTMAHSNGGRYRTTEPRLITAPESSQGSIQHLVDIGLKYIEAKWAAPRRRNVAAAEYVQ